MVPSMLFAELQITCVSKLQESGITENEIAKLWELLEKKWVPLLLIFPMFLKVSPSHIIIPNGVPLQTHKGIKMILKISYCTIVFSF